MKSVEEVAGSVQFGGSEGRIKDETEFPYAHVMVGGTFDRFHAGHRALLDKAFATGAVVDIGVSSDEFLASRNKTLRERIQSYEVRIAQIQEYLMQNGWLKRGFLTSLNYVFAPSALDAGIQGIVITPDSIEGAEFINQQRLAIGSPPLELIVIDFVSDESGAVISSTRLRQQEA